MTKETGGPAFPAEEDTEYPSSVVTTKHQGMTLRDYFAAKTMQGWLSTDSVDIDCHVRVKAAVAKFSYEMADAMLEARK